MSRRLLWRRWHHRFRDAWRGAVAGWRVGPDADLMIALRQIDDRWWRSEIQVSVPGQLGPLLVAADSFTLPPAGGYLWVAAPREGLRGRLARVEVSRLRHAR